MNQPVAPRVLDASAIVDLIGGHPALRSLLDDADAGEVILSVPALAVAEAQAVLRMGAGTWSHLFARPGLQEQPLTWHGAIEAGDIASPRLEHFPMQPALIGPLMVGQIVAEARAMKGAVVTRIPEAYSAYDVTVAVF